MLPDTNISSAMVSTSFRCFIALPRRELAEALSLSTLQERGAALFTIGISASTVRLTHRHPRRIVFLLQFLQTLFLGLSDQSKNPNAGQNSYSMTTCDEVRNSD